MRAKTLFGVIAVIGVAGVVAPTLVLPPTAAVRALRAALVPSALTSGGYRRLLTDILTTEVLHLHRVAIQIDAAILHPHLAVPDPPEAAVAMSTVQRHRAMENNVMMIATDNINADEVLRLIATRVLSILLLTTTCDRVAAAATVDRRLLAGNTIIGKCWTLCMRPL